MPTMVENIFKNNYAISNFVVKYSKFSHVQFLNSMKVSSSDCSL